MNAETIAVHWHDDNQPVYSVSFQPNTPTPRLASAGGDNNVRIWNINYNSTNSTNSTSTTVEYLLTLRKHTQAVNVVRFAPSGLVLASAGDDGMVILWTRSDKLVADFGHDDDDAKESWVARHVLSTQLEVYDLCWSPDGRFLATGSMDNVTKVFSAETGHKLVELAHHSHYVQGVAWDPQNAFLATQSADRSLQIYLLAPAPDGGAHVTPTQFFRVCRVDLPATRLLGAAANVHVPVAAAAAPDIPLPAPEVPMSPPAHNYVHRVGATAAAGTPVDGAVLPAVAKASRKKKPLYLFHSETLQSFFRRLAFSPDGALLVAPLGIYKDARSADDAACVETVYVFTRAGLNRPPVCHLPGLAKPAVAIAFSPVMYAKSGADAVFALPYKMVFAVATQNSVVIYDTQRLQPLGVQANLHYLTITDLCWNPDGRSILVSSTEGFCSVIRFDEGVFGCVYERGERAGEVEAGLAKTEAGTGPEKTETGPEKTEAGLAKTETGPEKTQTSQTESQSQTQPQTQTESQPQTEKIAHPDTAIHSSPTGAPETDHGPSLSTVHSNAKPPRTSPATEAKCEPSQTQTVSIPHNVPVQSTDRSPPLSGKRNSPSARPTLNAAQPSQNQSQPLQVTPSLLSQFVAPPVLAPVSQPPPSSTPEEDGAKKKRRIQPTLVQPEN